MNLSYRWDDLIVSAPMYSKSSMPEIGRIYIFENMDVSWHKSNYQIMTKISVAGNFN